MKCITALTFAHLPFAEAQWWAPGGMGWVSVGGGMGGMMSSMMSSMDCAVSCFKSAYPSDQGSWDMACATPTAMSSCMESSCSIDLGIMFSIMTSVQASMCSAYSECSTASESQAAATTCEAWGFFGPCEDGWMGGHESGWYTITGPKTGWATTTETVTSTLSGGSLTTTEATKTATVVAAAASGALPTGSQPSSSKSPREGVNINVVAIGILCAVFGILLS